MTQREPESDRRELVGRGEWMHEAVPPGCECPCCREWCMDLLVWLDDDIVRCTTCGTRYNPTTGQVVGCDDQAD